MIKNSPRFQLYPIMVSCVEILRKYWNFVKRKKSENDNVTVNNHG